MERLTDEMKYIEVKYLSLKYQIEGTSVNLI